MHRVRSLAAVTQAPGNCFHACQPRRERTPTSLLTNSGRDITSVPSHCVVVTVKTDTWKSNFRLSSRQTPF